MCQTNNVSSQQHESDTDSDQGLKLVMRGTRLGSASLGLLLLAYSLTMPHQQARRDDLGCETACVGKLASIRSALTLLGGMLVPALSDRAVWARKGCLYAGIGATSVGMVIAYYSRSLKDLYWTTSVSVFQQNFAVLRALLSQYYHVTSAPSSLRTTSTGFLGMSSGLAMMIGPILSVFLGNYDKSMLLAMGLLVVSGVMVHQLPAVDTAATVYNQSTSTKKSHQEHAQGERSWIPTAVRSPAVVLLLSHRLLSGLSYQIYQTIWNISLKERFDFGPKEYGQFFSMVGLFLALSQGVFAKWILATFVQDDPRKRTQLVSICALCITLFRYTAYTTTEAMAMYIYFALVVTAHGVLSTLISSDASHVVPSENAGTFYGVMSAVENAAGMVGPLLGGVVGSKAFHLCIALNAAGFGMMTLGYRPLIVSKIHANASHTKKRS